MVEIGAAGSFKDVPRHATAAAIRHAGFLLKRRIACYCALIVFAIGALVMTVVLEQRNSAVKRAQGNAANLSAAFEEQVRRVIDNVSGAMDLLTQRIQTEGPAFDLTEWTRRIPELAASTVHVSIIGADGKLAATTLGASPAPVDLSDREHFAVHRDNANSGLHVGKPVRGRISGQLTIQVTKRLEMPGGAFAGVLVFSLNPEFLTSLHRKVDLGDTGSIALVGKDGVIRARFTATQGLDSAVIGSSIAGSAAVIGALSSPSGTRIGASPVDGVTRILSWRTVAGYPLIVVVGLGKAEALAAANLHAKLVLVLGAAALALPLIMVVMLSREITRRGDREIALHTEDKKLRAANESLTLQHGALVATSAELASERIKLQEANAELMLAKQRAEEASGAKTSFLATMSHELRTPLNAIIGFSEIIRDRLFGEDLLRYSDCAADIQGSGVHLLNIINGVLDVAKIEAGKFILSEDVMRLDAIVAASLLAVTPQAANGQVELIVDLPVDGTRIRCDETRFKQILINLLANAIKFTQPGGSVTLRAQHEAQGGINLSISDTGIGMSQEEIGSAFELFRQVDNRLARGFEGSGLGLPLAVQLAKLHGATLELESTPNVGTAVWLRMPAERVISANPSTFSTVEERAAERRAAQRNPTKRVVFVYFHQTCFQTYTVDLSETGLCIEKVAGLGQGDKVRLDLGGHVAEGIVIWQSANHIGLKFVEQRPEPAERQEWRLLHSAA